MAENWLIDRRSAMRHAKTKKKLSKQDFVDLLHKKFANYERHVGWCNDICGHWRIRVWQTRENADASEAALELTRMWLFDHCKSFNEWPEQQRELGKQQAWTQFKLDKED
jgi:predicted signal transduction protein with EAL and GGDEF domain|tara:strand:- start:335 stop:664 length:330 start_codon:yes stop_codon:yes gene_type:complete